MPSQCLQCGAVLSLPGDSCQACGNPITRLGDGPPETSDVPSHTSVPSFTDLSGLTIDSPARDHEEVRLEELLDQYASQSHFEDRYEIKAKVGGGGMGSVYRAFDRILRREVAIKMMNASMNLAEAAVRGQFLKEAHVGARLLHPHVLSVFDLGVNRSRQIYFTMRLVDGGSLKDCLDALDKAVATKLVSYPLRKIVEALVRACQGVDYAHQNGIIHLDLKPQNVLVSGFNEVFVIDWGLARIDEIDDTNRLIDLYQNRSSSSNTLNNTGVHGNRVVGTAPYMAPEQMRGDVEDFDAATDVYGMGGILYFSLYNAYPNRGRTIVEMLSAMDRPRGPGKLRPGILPRGQRVSREVKDAVESLEQICLRAIAVDKRDRFADVEKLVIELSEWLASTPTPPVGL